MMLSTVLQLLKKQTHNAKINTMNTLRIIIWAHLTSDVSLFYHIVPLLPTLNQKFRKIISEKLSF